MNSTIFFRHFTYKVKSVWHTHVHAAHFGNQEGSMKKQEEASALLSPTLNLLTLQSPSNTENKMKITISIMAQVRANESTKDRALCGSWVSRLLRKYDDQDKILCFIMPSHQRSVQISCATIVLNRGTTQRKNSHTFVQLSKLITNLWFQI